eukprot:CAMPEP_0177542922 /NCGR_PEP_ID=MMETSP0369-20130122/61086_1 /TAXON_ID=447022 ORGANISM="Scrippsiella hangoei-like, Strain SHHI-4" /NCGR_SAMPLE_ID=MMETSP0369 /ASSEMBLY_ACC=CAM_ASM_000364 /LENGTH=72 /DNA_ID=CAMNT_0019026667 /DNA_START=72 /DNA_END=287 /DNA_ORIENTATION=-
MPTKLASVTSPGRCPTLSGVPETVCEIMGVEAVSVLWLKEGRGRGELRLSRRAEPERPAESGRSSKGFVTAP